MLEFNPAKRITVEDSFKHQFLKAKRPPHTNDNPEPIDSGFEYQQLSQLRLAALQNLFGKSAARYKHLT